MRKEIHGWLRFALAVLGAWYALSRVPTKEDVDEKIAPIMLEVQSLNANVNGMRTELSAHMAKHHLTLEP